jgi:hypothetical protein
MATHRYILDELQKLGILYVHFSNAMVDGRPTISTEFLREARGRFKRLIMVAGGYTVAGMKGTSVIRRWPDAGFQTSGKRARCRQLGQGAAKVEGRIMI